MQAMSNEELIRWRLERVEEAHRAADRRTEELEREIISIKISLARWAAVGAGGGALISRLVELLVEMAK